MKARIALIHAVTVAMEPVHEVFRRLWPEAECCNILDDSLSLDRERDGVLTAAMRRRIGDLAEYAAAIGADGILFTCSAFGDAIEAAAGRLPIPVLKPNEQCSRRHWRSVGASPCWRRSPRVSARWKTSSATWRQPANLERQSRPIVCPGAMAALKAGDGEEHNRLIAEAAPRFADRDAVLLAHFSTARAAPAVTAALDRPVLASPNSAVAKPRGIIGRLQSNQA
jgi:hypothetical protein